MSIKQLKLDHYDLAFLFHLITYNTFITLKYICIVKNRLITHSDKFKPYYSLNYIFNDFNYEVFVVNDTNPTTYENNLAFFKSSETFVGFMSDDEVNEYNEIVKDLTLKYNDRLEKFYLTHREKIKNVRSDKQ